MARRLFDGSVTWIEPGDWWPVDCASVRSADEIGIDLTYEQRRYTVTLRRNAGAKFEGKYKTLSEAGTVEGNVTCRMFDLDDGGVVLIGRWSEDGVSYSWVVDLQPSTETPLTSERGA